MRRAAAATVQREFTASATHCRIVFSPVRAMPGRHCPAPRPRLPLISLFACALLGLCAPWPLPAQERDERPHARLPESVRRIERETGGKVLQVRPIQRGDREIYRMKVLTPDGRVKIVQDDPKRPREREPARESPRDPPSERDRGDPSPPPEHF